MSRLFSDEVAGRILTALRMGVSVPKAAIAGGVDVTTLRSWMRWGLEGQPDWAEFSKQVNTAILQYELRLLKTVNAAVERGDAKLALDVLARRFPESWGRTDTVKLGGSEDVPLTVNIVFPNSGIGIIDSTGEDVVEAEVVPDAPA